jgi:phosphoglycerate dehydrogenase-like enzyme
MRKVAIITTAFGYGLMDREIEYGPLFKNYDMEPVYCTRDDLISQGGMGCRGIIAGTEAVDQCLFNACADLKAVMKYGVGLDNFDQEEAKRRGILIGNMPGINSDSVAELVFGLMLAVSRKIVEQDAWYRKGEKRQMCSRTLFNKTLGLIGTGTIGRRVACLSRAFHMNCIGYDITRSSEAGEAGICYVSWETLFAEADVVSIHIPLNRETYHLVGEKEFKKMKPTALLINTSRGGIVDEKALVRAIKNGDLGGAGLDVFEGNGVDEDLAALPEIVCTPHVAAFTHETLRTMDREVIRKLADSVG